MTDSQDRQARVVQRARDGGVPRLMEHLSALLCEPVHLWYSPPPAGDDIRWRVWTSTPTGTGGGEWGRGTTAFEALEDAYKRAVEAIFDGRLSEEELQARRERMDKAYPQYRETANVPTIR